MTARFDFIQSADNPAADGRIATLGETPAEFHRLVGTDTVSPLADRGAIQASGPDTIKLLQGQLTCDLKQLGAGGVLKGALCDVKGRMVSSLLCIASAPETVMLVLPAALVNTTLETLEKYAVFFKTTLTDISDDIAAFGVQGREPQLTDPTHSHLAPVTEGLNLVITSRNEAEATWLQLKESHKPCGDELWNYLLIHRGEGEVKPETSGEFIPQMLNFQHTGAVSFRKGCYTGQEIVARMQYLGKLKRRMYRLRVGDTTPPLPGTTIGSGQKKDVGTVVMAAPVGDSCELLTVLTAASATEEALIIGETETGVEILSLPYDDRLEAAE